MFKIFPTPKSSQLKLKLSKKSEQPKKNASNEHMTLAQSIAQNGVFVFSEHIKHRGEIHLTKDDIIMLSHKSADGSYQTTVATLDELRSFILDGIDFPETKEKQEK